MYVSHDIPSFILDRQTKKIKEHKKNQYKSFHSTDVGRKKFFYMKRKIKVILRTPRDILNGC